MLYKCIFLIFCNPQSDRNVLGTRNLGDILSEREAIASEMQQGLDSATAPWGVLVERVEVVEYHLMFGVSGLVVLFYYFICLLLQPTI